MASLEIFVKTLNPHLYTTGRVELIIEVTSNGIKIQNANIAVTTTGGILSLSSGLTDVNGIFRTVFSPSTSPVGTYIVTFVATKSPLTSDTETTNVVVETAPFESTTKDTELLIGVRAVRQKILDYLQQVLLDDPDLYISTGATKPPVFLNAFSYTVRDFPQIVTSSGTLVPRRVSIGDNIIGWSTDTDGNKYKLRGGIHDSTILLTVIAEDKSTQENLLDKITMILWQKKMLNFLAGDIWILSVNAGGETTEPWGDKLLYAGSITVSISTQWQLKEKYTYIIDEINYDQQVQELQV